MAATRPSPSRVSGVSCSGIEVPLRRPRAQARNVSSAPDRPAPPLVIVHLTVPLERSRSREGSSSARTRRQRPATDGVRGWRPRPRAALRGTSALPGPSARQRPVDGRRGAAAAHARAPMPARANSTSAAPQPRCRNAAALARRCGAAIPRCSASGGGSSANTCVKRSAGPAPRSSARYSHSTGAAAARARSKASAAATRRQAHPRRAPEARRAEVALEQRRAPRHVGAQDEQRTRRSSCRSPSTPSAPSPRRSTTVRRRPFALAGAAGLGAPRRRAQTASHHPASSRRAGGRGRAVIAASSGCSERSTRRGSTAPATRWPPAARTRSWRRLAVAQRPAVAAPMPKPTARERTPPEVTVKRAWRPSPIGRTSETRAAGTSRLTPGLPIPNGRSARAPRPGRGRARRRGRRRRRARPSRGPRP